MIYVAIVLVVCFLIALAVIGMSVRGLPDTITQEERDELIENKYWRWK